MQGQLTAMQAQLTEMKANTKMQEVAFQQWVNVEPESVQDSEDPFSDTFEIDLRFVAINNTAFPLTIEKIVTKVSLKAETWDVFTVDTNAILPPSKDGKRSEYPFYVRMAMEVRYREQFKNGTFLTINGTVIFTDCLKEPNFDWFGGIYTCNTDTGAFDYLRPLGVEPKHHTEKHP